MMAKESQISTTQSPGAASSNAPKMKNLTSDNDPTTTKTYQDAGSKKRLDFYRKVTRYSKPLNILVLGAAGAGKSSFINSCIRAVRKEAGQWVAVGYGGDTPNITTVLRRINMYFPDQDNPRIKQDGRHIDAPDAGPIAVEEAPSIIDVCGMPDENTELVRTVLRLLLYGHFELDKHNILDIQANADPHHPLDLLQKYPQGNEDLVIHRVIFVASAKGDLPRELMKAVMETAKPSTHIKYGGVISKRTVPVFGLMTKQDLVEVEDDMFKVRKKDFIQALSLRGAARNFSLCRNYVSEDGSESEDSDTEDNNDVIDEMMLKFMCNVCDPTHHIDNPDWTLHKESLSSKFRATLERHQYVWAVAAVFVVLCLLCFTYVGTNTVYIPFLVVLFLWYLQT